MLFLYSFTIFVVISAPGEIFGVCIFCVCNSSLGKFSVFTSVKQTVPWNKSYIETRKRKPELAFIGEGNICRELSDVLWFKKRGHNYFLMS